MQIFTVHLLKKQLISKEMNNDTTLKFACRLSTPLMVTAQIEWSAIWSEIKRVITKWHDREAENFGEIYWPIKQSITSREITKHEKTRKVHALSLGQIVWHVS